MPKQSKTDSGPQPAGAAAKTGPEAVATVGDTVTIEGDVTGRGDVFISGTVKGAIDLADNQVTVERAGRIEGRIVGKQVQVDGKVVGDIEAMEKIAIGSTGTVRGTIIAPRVVVEDGARFNGLIDMEFGEGLDAPAATVLSK